MCCCMLLTACVMQLLLSMQSDSFCKGSKSRHNSSRPCVATASLSCCYRRSQCAHCCGSVDVWVTQQSLVAHMAVLPVLLHFRTVIHLCCNLPAHLVYDRVQCYQKFAVVASCRLTPCSLVSAARVGRQHHVLPTMSNCSILLSIHIAFLQLQHVWLPTVHVLAAFAFMSCAVLTEDMHEHYARGEWALLHAVHSGLLLCMCSTCVGYVQCMCRTCAVHVQGLELIPSCIDNLNLFGQLAFAADSASRADIHSTQRRLCVKSVRGS